MVVPEQFRKSSGLSVNVNAVDLTSGVIKQPFYLLTQGNSPAGGAEATSYALVTTTPYSDLIYEETTTTSVTFESLFTRDFNADLKAPLQLDGQADFQVAVGVNNTNAMGSGDARVSFALIKVDENSNETNLSNSWTGIFSVGSVTQTASVLSAALKVPNTTLKTGETLKLSATLQGRHTNGNTATVGWAFDPQNRGPVDATAFASTDTTNSQIAMPIKPTF